MSRWEKVEAGDTKGDSGSTLFLRIVGTSNRKEKKRDQPVPGGCLSCLASVPLPL